MVSRYEYDVVKFVPKQNNFIALDKDRNVLYDSKVSKFII